MRATCLGAALLLCSLAVAAKNNPSGVSDAEAKRFLVSVQTAVSENDTKRIATLIEFPLSVNSATAKRRVKTSREFLEGIDKIITPVVREKILAQQPAKLFHRADGVMIGDGEVWFRAICSDEKCETRRTRIVTVNVPAEAQ